MQIIFFPVVISDEGKRDEFVIKTRTDSLELDLVILHINPIPFLPFMHIWQIFLLYFS